jgi:hypothetical protein
VHLWTLFAIGIVVFSNPGYAQSADEFQAKRERQNYSGWKGLVFSCGGVIPTAILADCEQVWKHVQSLAKIANVPIERPRTYEEFFARKASADLMALRISISTSSGTAPYAVSALVEGYVTILDAVSASADKNSARAQPRLGHLLIFQRSVVLPSRDLIDVSERLVHEINGHTLEFLTTYINAQRAGPPPVQRRPARTSLLF